MITSLIRATGSVLIGLFLWELIKMCLYGALIAFTIRALGGDFSIFQTIYDTVGIYGVLAALVLYIIRAVRNVERHIGKYEKRILDRDDS